MHFFPFFLKKSFLGITVDDPDRLVFNQRNNDDTQSSSSDSDSDDSFVPYDLKDDPKSGNTKKFPKYPFTLLWVLVNRK